MAENTDTHTTMTRRLDALISLLVEWELTEEGLRRRTAEDQTMRLARVGLRPIEIAAITGRAVNNITRDLAKQRKSSQTDRKAKPTRGKDGRNNRTR